MNFKTLLTIAAITAVTQVTGCTLVPMTASIDAPVATSKNPGGPAVKIVSVTDNRQFVYPHQADDCVTPSVDGEKMLKDEATKARSYSRQGGCTKGEWANHAMVMVPEGQTVASNIKNAVAVGLSNAGYNVDPVDVADDAAIPIAISLNQFWVGRELDGMGAGYTITYAVDVATPTEPNRIKASTYEKTYTDTFVPGRGYYESAAHGLKQLADAVAARFNNQSLK